MDTPDDPPFVERAGGRVILIDAASSDVLLIRGRDPQDVARGDFWITPGGGIDEGEDLRGGTTRELQEEVGLLVSPETLGPVVLRRVGEFAFAGALIRQIESYFALTVERFDPEPQVVTAFEEGVIQELRWRPITELSASIEPVYPWCLVDLVNHIRSHGPPDPPWVEEQRLV